METVYVSHIEYLMHSAWPAAWWILGIGAVVLVMLGAFGLWLTTPRGDLKDLRRQLLLSAAPFVALWLYLMAGFVAFVLFAQIVDLVSRYMNVDLIVVARLNLPLLLVTGVVYLLAARRAIGHFTRLLIGRIERLPG